MKFSSALAPVKADQDDSLIPLINVVFLMLIFFMIAGQISRTDKETVTLPESVTQSPVPDSTVRVIVADSGAIYVNDDLLELAELKRRLMQLFQASANPESFRVQIKADADLPVSQLQGLFQEVRSAGLNRLSLLTEKLTEMQIGKPTEQQSASP